MLVKPDSPQINWLGAVSLQKEDGFVRPWRLVHNDFDLFYAPGLQNACGMTSGVRMTFRTDATKIKLKLQHQSEHYVVASANGTMLELPHCLFDIFVDGEKFTTISLADDDDFLSFGNLPAGMHDIEIWFPTHSTLKIYELQLQSATKLEAIKDERPRWVVYGSSITHCVRAETPSLTWPAIVANEFDWNLTSLGLGGQCKIEDSMAKMIRDLPADILTLKLGINTYTSDLSPRTFPTAVIGMIRTIREKHETTPLVICSPIISPPRETTPSVSGQTLVQMRDDIVKIVNIFRQRGDKNIYYIGGLEIFGEELLKYMPDQLHPDANGIKVMAQNFIREIKKLKIKGVINESIN